MPPIKDIGCSTCCLMDRTLEEALGFISRRTNRAEVLSDGPHSLFHTEEACYSFDLRYTVHAPVADINIASDNEHLRRASVRVLDDLTKICDRIGAERLVVHPGHFWGEEMQDAAGQALNRSLGDLAAIQEEVNVRLAVENMGAWDICFFREPEFLDRLADLGLGFALDVGHAHVNGNLDSFLERGGAIHVHLHDNFGSRDDHMACGEGNIEFCRVMQAIPQNATKVVEPVSFRQYESSLNYLRSVFP
ncbi:MULTISPECIES: sugar phosphate isomerase/epimerase family protein [unclassified Methanoculleus]|jgi:sugar phosphate isomerase/epimerase|uniref:Sugar phosphate isomerase/epimerase family protein n=1 Tax=Methanoculleus palmolei TaxID=72612 RepID=A0ABD8A6Z0_9EURY|nr:sugar phosphate isomerase/epimerase family protein [Methanoculleus sp. UBA377]WOX55298.1 sugar phosphate isomerase/epimerase family protein [Methanoculleus palmolei]